MKGGGGRGGEGQHQASDTAKTNHPFRHPASGCSQENWLPARRRQGTQ